MDDQALQDIVEAIPPGHWASYGDVTRAESPGGVDEFPLAQGERFPPHDPRERHPSGQAEDQDQVREAGAQHGEHRDGQHQHGEGELDIAHTHEDVVEASPVVSGDEAERHPDDPRP